MLGQTVNTYQRGRLQRPLLAGKFCLDARALVGAMKGKQKAVCSYDETRKNLTVQVGALALKVFCNPAKL